MTEHKEVKDAVWEITDEHDIRSTVKATKDELKDAGVTDGQIDAAKDDRALTTKRHGGKAWLVWNENWNESFF